MLPGRRAEYFTATEIHERDNWTCQICGSPVKRWLKFPHPDSPSIDHITPLEHGGDHTRQNVRCAHLRCNQQRPKDERPVQTEMASEGPRWGDRDLARSRELIASHNHTVQAILEQNRQALGRFPLTLDMLTIAHVTTCKNSVSRNGRSRIEESGRDSILGIWRHFGFNGNGSTVRIARDILTALKLILRIDATWSPRRYKQAGRCQRWVPVGQSWSLPILQRVNPDELTTAQILERGLYLAAQSRRERYEERHDVTIGTNAQDEGVRQETFSTQWSNHSEAYAVEPYPDHYEQDQDEDDGICVNQYQEPTIRWGDTAYLGDDDADEVGPPAEASWDVEHYAYEDEDDWAQAFDWNAGYEDLAAA